MSEWGEWQGAVGHEVLHPARIVNDKHWEVETRV